MSDDDDEQTGIGAPRSGRSTMNAMGHNVPTMIGIDHRRVAQQTIDLVPDYMMIDKYPIGV